MQIYDSIEAALKEHPGAYVSFQKIGECMVCKQRHDLRCGVCFDCCAKVDGEPVKGGHRLWERANHSNTWYVGA